MLVTLQQQANMMQAQATMTSAQYAAGLWRLNTPDLLHQNCLSKHLGRVQVRNGNTHSISAQEGAILLFAQ